jgi:membrane-bound ClpP family serine protease
MIGLLSLVVMSALLIVGMILMGVNRGHLGSSATLGIVGCVLLLLGGLFSFLLPLIVDSMDLSFSDVALVWSLISLIFHGGGTGLLIWAVVAKRNQPPYAQPQQPQGPGGWQQQQPQGPGGWQQQQPQGPGGWQQPQQPWQG